MKTLKTIFAAILLATANCLLPTANLFSQHTGLQYIEVTGTAEQEIAPDEIFISFTIAEKIAAAGASPQERITIEKQEEKLKKELKNTGIDLKNLTPAPARKGIAAAGIPGKNYVLKVSSPSLLEKVFTQLEKLEIRGAYISNQSYSKIEELKKETEITAMKAAKEKAIYLLAAIGEQIGKAIMVQEKIIEKLFTGDPSASPPAAAGALISSAGAAAFAPLASPSLISESPEIRNIKVKAEVLVRFEIK